MSSSYIFPSVYKKDTKGKIREWTLWVEHDDEDSTIHTKAGIYLKDSSYVNHEKLIAASKHKDARTRAVDLAKGKFSRKMESGYCKTVEEAEDWVPSRPMLSKTTYLDELETLDYPVICQPKIDGVRCIFKGDKEPGRGRLQSRLDKPFMHIPHIEDWLTGEYGVYLDGEIYHHGTRLQDIVHHLKNPRVYSGKLDLTYVLFDMPDRLGTPYIKRLGNLLDWYGKMHSDVKEQIKVLSFSICGSPDEVKAYYTTCLDEGYEGIMVKSMDSQYQWDSRTGDSLKLKPVLSSEFKIVDTTHEDFKIIFICSLDDGTLFEVVPAWNHSGRRESWRHRGDYEDKMLTVEYRNLTKSGIPFHAVGVAVRSYE